MSVALLALGVATSSSARTSENAHTRLIASQAAHLLAERLRAQPYGSVYTNYWAAPGLKVAADEQTRRRYVVGGTPDGAIANTLTEVLEPHLKTGRISAPEGGELLSIRFLSEAEYNTRTGLVADLDHDGSTSGTIGSPSGGGAAPGYSYYPVLIRVRFQDRSGDHVHTLLITLADRPSLDPKR